MEERVEGRMKGSEGERWVTPSPALRTRGIRTSGMIRHSVAFRAEQQRETSRPLPGTPSVEEQDTGPYGLVDASYLYEDCYKSQEDDDRPVARGCGTGSDTVFKTGLRDCIHTP